MTSIVSAQTINNEIEEELYNIWELKEQDLEFNSFSSCVDMNNTLEEYISENWKHRWWPRIMPMMAEEMAMDGSFGGTTWAPAPIAAKSSISWADLPLTWWPWVDSFSETNTQVTWVDEPDIFKNNGEHLFYYNQRENSVQIITSPHPETSNFSHIADINLPKTMQWAQLFLYGEKLVIMANRYRNTYSDSFLNTQNKTDIIVYDIKDPVNPKLIKFTELDGNYTDARMIDWELTILSSLWLNRHRPTQYWNNAEEMDLEEISILPKNIDIAYTTESSKQNLNNGDESFPYSIQVNKVDCADINYVLPTAASTQNINLDPSFTIISTINLNETSNKPKTTVAFGNTSSNHLSKDSLYLTTNVWVPWNSTCPINARCIWDGGFGSQQTLIHKFDRINGTYAYLDSTLVTWSPLTQYSMDEDQDGNFRILTSVWDRESSTNFYVLDKNLELKWSVLDIEPGESFQSSRYIWDKLYLVTFERTDPLFVIDIADTSNPKIVGELKIPWFSTYLHPYGTATDGVQYLLWLWFDASENQRWGIQNWWIKLDLYKIDYNKKDSEGMLATTQEYSQIFGDQWSQTEATYNPRMFVWDPIAKNLYMPIQLNTSSDKQNCEIELDGDWNEIFRECRDDNQSEPDFRWYTALHVTSENGIQELESHNFMNILKQDTQIYNRNYLNTWDLMPRVWYIKSGEKTTMYMLNGLFGHTTILWSQASEEVYIDLGKNWYDYNQ